MVTLHDSLVSSSARKMPIRKRPDLSAPSNVSGTHLLGRQGPIGLNYFRFQEEEYALLQMLDGQTSLDELKERFEDDSPAKDHPRGAPAVFGHAAPQRAGGGRRARGRDTSPNAAASGGGRNGSTPWPTSSASASRVSTRSISWAALPLGALVLCARWWWRCACCDPLAATLVTVRFQSSAQAPGLPPVLQLLQRLLALRGAVRDEGMHEFGHGLSCKHFGGECHEMGVMILVLTPCLYCNVSDSWMLPSKWHRAAIGAAGMYVELVLASLATFVWWWSEPGVLYYLCLNVMFICWVTTLIFNANPLLRYDGYYILADVMEIPTCGKRPPHPQPQGWRLVPRTGTAGRPLPPPAQPDLLRALFSRRGGVSLGRGVLHPLVSLQRL